MISIELLLPSSCLRQRRLKSGRFFLRVPQGMVLSHTKKEMHHKGGDRDHGSLLFFIFQNVVSVFYYGLLLLYFILHSKMYPHPPSGSFRNGFGCGSGVQLSHAFLETANFDMDQVLRSKSFEYFVFWCFRAALILFHIINSLVAETAH